MSGSRAPTPSASTRRNGENLSRANTARRRRSSICTRRSWSIIATARSASRLEQGAHAGDQQALTTGHGISLAANILAGQGGRRRSARESSDVAPKAAADPAERRNAADDGLWSGNLLRRRSAAWRPPYPRSIPLVAPITRDFQLDPQPARLPLLSAHDDAGAAMAHGAWPGWLSGF